MQILFRHHPPFGKQSESLRHPHLPVVFKQDKLSKQSAVLFLITKIKVSIPTYCIDCPVYSHPNREWWCQGYKYSSYRCKVMKRRYFSYHKKSGWIGGMKGKSEKSSFSIHGNSGTIQVEIQEGSSGIITSTGGNIPRIDGTLLNNCHYNLSIFHTLVPATTISFLLVGVVKVM